MGFVEFVQDRWTVLSFLAYQHMSLVVQTLVVATVIALLIGILIYRSPWGVALGNTVTAVGLTIPSYA
ncbi:MAG: ABC transporter permease, partial [Mycobacterium sp.]|nr:ABC transporter permease [Mycobacterium sp.]